MTRSFTLLVNRVAGGGVAPTRMVPVARLLRDAGARVEVAYAPGETATAAMVDDAVERGDVLVSVGGDGMLASVAGLVVERGGVLGILPAGRGNDFARMLGVPSEPAAVAERLLTAEPVATDLLATNVGGDGRRVVAGSVYAGVDAIAGEIVDRVRWMPRRVQYPYAAVRAMATYVPVRARIVVDGEVHEANAATVVVANSAYYGSGMKISPESSVTDGLLDVVVIEAASRRELVRALPKVYDGAHVALPAVQLLRGRRVELSGTPRVPVGGDGEPLGWLPEPTAAPLVIEVLPGALQVLV